MDSIPKDPPHDQAKEKASLHDVADILQRYLRRPEDMIAVLQVLRGQSDRIATSCRLQDATGTSAWWCDAQTILHDAEKTAYANLEHLSNSLMRWLSERNATGKDGGR